jgi:hypothetical protein
VARLRPRRWGIVIGAEIELDVLAGAERLAGAGEHQNLRLRIDGELGQRIVHLEMELGTDGVALLRPVHDQPGDAVLLLDQHGFIFLRCHSRLLAWTPQHRSL